MQKKIFFLEQELNNNPSDQPKQTLYLLEANKFPHSMYLYLDKIFTSFKHDHNLICILLSNCSSIESKQTLGTFFSEFLNSNLFSPLTLDEEYILILTRMLIPEIASISDSNPFLSNESTCKYLLSNLYKTEEIKEYFIHILKPCLTEIESWNTYVSFEINDIINTIREELKAKSILRTGETSSSSDNITDSFLEMVVDPEKLHNLYLKIGKNGVVPLTKVINKRKEYISKDEFFNEYVPNLTKEMLKECLNNSSHPDSKYFIAKHICKLELNRNDKFLFANEKLFLNLGTIPGIEGKETIELFRDYLGKCIKLIQKIIHRFTKHIDIIPNSIKNIIKIIETLFKRQYKSINNVDLFAHLSKFFINLLFYPIFIHPDKYGLIDNILTPYTKHNVELIANVIKQFFSGELFVSSDKDGLPIFNVFFTKNYDTVSCFYEKFLQKANVPSIVDEFILSSFNSQTSNEDKLINKNVYDYKYVFFERYPHEHIKEGIVLFDINLALTTLEVMNKAMEELKTYSKEQQAVMNSNTKVNYVDSCIKCVLLIFHQKKNELLKQELQNEIKLNKRSLYGFINSEYSPTFTAINKLTEGTISFSINDNNNTDNKNTINIFKNSICKLLYNTYPLKQSCLYIASTTEHINTIDLIALLNKANDISYSCFKTDIEMSWTAHILEDIILQFPQGQTSKYFSAIYEELLNDLQKEKEDIKTYNEAISSLYETMRYADKHKSDVSRMWTSIKEEQFKKIIKRLIMEDKSYSYNVGLLKKKGSYSANLTMEYVHNKGKTLFDFCNNFPNFMARFELESNPFDMLDEININNLLKICFVKVKKAVTEQFFRYGMDKLIERKTPQLSKYEIEYYSEEQQKKIINEIKIRDDKEIKERFIREYGYSKKKSKSENIFYWSDMELINQISEIIQEFIMFRLYPVFFPSEQTKEDKRLHQKLRALEMLCKPKSIKKNIPHENIVIASVPKARKYFKQFETARTPKTKNKALLKLIDLFIQIINYGKINPDIPTVDDMLPLLMYFLIKSCPLLFDSSVRYLEVFLQIFVDSEKYLALFKTPKILLQNIDVSVFAHISTQDEFDKQLEESLSKTKLMQ